MNYRMCMLYLPVELRVELVVAAVAFAITVAVSAGVAVAVAVGVNVIQHKRAASRHVLPGVLSSWRRIYNP